MLDLLLIAFIVLTIFVFLFAYLKEEPPPPPPPQRGATLPIDWSVTNSKNVTLQGQATIDEANLRQLKPVDTVAIGDVTYKGPSLKTVMAEIPITYRALYLESFPPTDPILKDQAGAWIVATSTVKSDRESELRGNSAFQLVQKGMNTPHQLYRIFAR